MSYSYNPNYQSHSTPVTEITAVPTVTEDFTPFVESSNKSRRVFKNMTTPIGKDETITFEYRNVANIYANSGIDPVFWTPTKRGIRLYASVSDVWTAIDSTDATAPHYDSPFSASLILQVPQNEILTEEDAARILNRLIGILYANGRAHWGKLLRGSTDFTNFEASNG